MHQVQLLSCSHSCGGLTVWTECSRYGRAPLGVPSLNPLLQLRWAGERSHLQTGQSWAWCYGAPPLPLQPAYGPLDAASTGAKKMGMQSPQYTDYFCMLHTNHVDSHTNVAEAVMNLRQNNVLMQQLSVTFHLPTAKQHSTVCFKCIHRRQRSKFGSLL